MREQQVEVEDIEYSKAGLDEATVRAIVTAAGSVAAVLNTRHAVAKAHGWAAAPPSAAEFARAVAAEPNLLRRPILIVASKAGSTAIVGFDRAAYGKLG